MRLPIPQKFAPLVALVGCLAVATFAAVLSLYQVTPTGLKARHVQIAAMASHVMVDLPTSLSTDRHAEGPDFQAVERRTTLLGELMTSDPVRDAIARRAGIEPSQLTATPTWVPNVAATLNEPDSERRASMILNSFAPDHINVQPDDLLPELHIYTQAPDAATAQRIAEAAPVALEAYLRGLAPKAGANSADQVRLRSLGDPRGGVINAHAKYEIGGLTFVVTFALAVSALAVLTRRRRRRRGGRRPAAAAPAPSGPAPRARLGFNALRVGMPPGAVALAPGGVALAGPVALERPPAGRVAAVRRAVVRGAGDWPRTPRVLPWMLAGFMAVVFLTPFNVIQLSVSLPIDLKLDRLILPFVIVAWALAAAAGGRHAPRIRLTWIHVALGAFVLVSCLSLVLDAGYLNQTLEFSQAVKQLTLLGSYLSLFVIAASVIRRTELKAFTTYTLWLAVLCALGTIVEYRFHYNVFYSLSGKLLPGIFTVGSAESSAVDQIGRRIVRGPGEVPLECVAMLSMALPIALIGVMRTSATWKTRIWYGVAACLIVAAIVSTYRKSAFLAPISVFATIAYFRRRDLHKLSPLGVVLLAAVHVLSPGAFGSIASQLHGNRLTVNTVSDRSSDYDAVRPDVWSHLAFGRGYGSYQHFAYRILDQELLHRLIEVGVFGVTAYIAMVVAAVVTAAKLIRGGGEHAGLALACAAAAVCFLVASTLFDILSFPHCPYIFLWMSALLAVAVKGSGSDEEEVPQWSS